MKERVMVLMKALWDRPLEHRVAALLAVAGILAAAQGARYSVARFQTTELQRTLAHMGETPHRDDAPDAKKYEDILKKGLFGQPPPEGGAPSGFKLFGVLGGTALMGPAREGIQPYEAGKELPDGSKLVSVGTNSVVIEKDGKQTTLEAFDPANAVQPSGNEGPPKPEGPGPGGPPPPGAPGVGPPPPPGAGGSGAPSPPPPGTPSQAPPQVVRGAGAVEVVVEGGPGTVVIR